MQKFKVISGFILLAATASAVAQEDRNNQLMKSLYAKFEDVLSVNSYQAATRAGMFVIAAPGQQIDYKLDPKKPEDKKKIVAFFDVIPQANWVYRASSSNVSDLYQGILANHEPALTVPTATQQAQLLAAQKIIYKNTQHAEYSDDFKRYQKTRSALGVALGKMQDFQREHPDLSAPPALTDALAQANDDYNLIGDKNKFIAAKAIVDNLENLNPNVYWGKLNERYTNNTFPVGVDQIPAYNFNVPYESWTDQSQSWITYNLTDSDIESHSSSSHSSVSGGLSGGWGMFSFGGSYGHSESATHVSVDGKNFTLQFELLRVSIERPWLDGGVFRSQTWQWQPQSNYAGHAISDGADVDAGKMPSGLMPLLTTELILARNVQLTANWSTDIKSTFEQQTTTSVSAGWGPFSGNYSRTDANATADGSVKISGNTITFVKPQIIGYLVEVVPASPTVRPGLKFASDTPTKVGNLMLESKSATQFNAVMGADKILLEQVKKFLKK